MRLAQAVLRFLFLLSLFVPLCGIAEDQVVLEFTDPDRDGHPAHQADGSLKIGYFLEQEFKQYFLGCSQNTPMKKDGETVSSIPVSILNAIGEEQVWQWVMKPNEYSVGNAFSILTKDQTLPGTFVPTVNLPMDPLQNPAEMLPSGTSKIIYSSNCTGILAAAVGVDSHISFPLGKLSSVVQADYQNSYNGELGVIKGVFNSPFFQLYGEQSDKVHAAFAHFVLWDWYRKRFSGQPSVPADKYYGLLWFNGFSLYRVNKQARRVDGSVDLSGNVNYLGLVDVNGSLKGNYQSFGATEVDNYKFATLSGTADSPSYQYQQMESPDLVAAWVKQNIFASLDTSNFSNVIHKGTPEIHKQVIQGLPSGLCAHTLWTANPSSFLNTGTVGITGETVLPVSTTQTLPGCELSITFTPADQVFTSSTPVSLQYALDTTVADKTLEISAGAVSFQTNLLPALMLASAAPADFQVTAQAPGYLLQWDLKAVLQDDTSDPINPAPGISAGALTLTGCQNKGPLAIIGSPTLTSAHQLTVSIQQFVQTATAPNPSATDNVTCTVGLTVQAKTTAGHPVNLPFPSGMLIFYPNLNLAPAPHFQLMTLEKLQKSPK